VDGQRLARLGLSTGSAVEENQMVALFGDGCHPEGVRIAALLRVDVGLCRDPVLHGEEHARASLFDASVAVRSGPGQFPQPCPPLSPPGALLVLP
jgi:hypothetical protein